MYAAHYKKNKKTLNASGFTLIELLISMVVMIIIFSFGAANYRGYQRRQYLETAIKQVESEVRLARDLAVAGKKPESGCGTLVGYSFRTNTSTKTYSFGAVCDNFRKCWSGGYYSCEKQNVPLPEDISFSGSNVEIMFKVLGGGVNTTNYQTIVVRLSPSEWGRIRVDKTGKIEVDLIP